MRLGLAALALAAPLGGTPAAAAEQPRVFDPASARPSDWRAELGFTDEQARRFEAAGESRARAVEPVRESQRAAHARLRELLSRGADEAALAGTLEELARLRDALQRENARYDQELASFLTPTQRARLLVLMQGLRRTDASPASFSSKS